VNVKVHRGRPLIASFGKRARCLGDDPCYRDPDGVGCLQALRSCRCDDISGGRTAVSVDRREHERACRQRFKMLARFTAHYRGGLSQHQAQRRCAHNGMILWSQAMPTVALKSKSATTCGVHLPSIAAAACLWSRAPIRAAMSVAFGLHSSDGACPHDDGCAATTGAGTLAHTPQRGRGEYLPRLPRRGAQTPLVTMQRRVGAPTRMPPADQRSRELF
jgi:hypothetical protein